MAESQASRRFTVDEIRSFWKEQALAHGQSPAASWSDISVIELEIEAIGRRIAPGSTVIDAGCANGYSSARFAGECGATVLGVDYIDEMIDEANRRRELVPAEVQARLEFRTGDIRALAAIDASFDIAISTRVIINLPTRDEQRSALLEVARVVRPGGLLLVSEATLQGWRSLNEMRREFTLPDIPMPTFNNYVDEDEVVEILAPVAELETIECFASTYFVGTRVLKPLLAAAAPGSVDVADPTMEINRWLACLPAWGDYGPQKLFVLRRR